MLQNTAHDRIWAGEQVTFSARSGYELSAICRFSCCYSLATWKQVHNRWRTPSYIALSICSQAQPVNTFYLENHPSLSFIVTRWGTLAQKGPFPFSVHWYTALRKCREHSRSALAYGLCSTLLSCFRYFHPVWCIVRSNNMTLRDISDSVSPRP